MGTNTFIGKRYIFYFLRNLHHKTSDMAMKRINKEINDLKKSPIENIKISYDEKDIFKWDAYITGPEKSPYSGHVFKVCIKFPTDYPFKPPKVHMDTKIFHPNIDQNGQICLDILKDKWSPALYTDSPLNQEAARLYKRDREGYDRKVKEWAGKYA